MDTPRQKPPRYDYAVKIEGPLLGPIRDAAVRLWNRIAMARLEHRWRVSHPVPPHVARAGSQRAALVVRDNLRHRRDIEEAYLARSRPRGRRSSLRAPTSFPEAFSPRAHRRRGAASARGSAASGARRVRDAALRFARLYGPLLEAGVEIYEYHKSFMHAKVAVIDGHWATVARPTSIRSA